MKEGWICPRCKKVNAPFTPYCDCQENSCTNYALQVDCINGYHQWECTGMSTAGLHTDAEFVVKQRLKITM